jgi:hypothetical protein
MKPACLPPDINPTCIDPTPDGVTCFSYTHCLNVRSGSTSYVAERPEPTGCAYGDSIPLNSEKCTPTYGSVKELPRTGSSVEILLPIVCTIAIVGLWVIIKKLIKT